MPNKEQKKFKEVIKKRRTRALRKLHPMPKFKWTMVEVPKPQVVVKPGVISKVKSWLKRK